MEEEQKQPDTPGIGGQSFKIEMKQEWCISRERMVELLRQAMYGTQDILDRMVNRYNSQEEIE